MPTQNRRRNAVAAAADASWKTSSTPKMQMRLREEMPFEYCARLWSGRKAIDSAKAVAKALGNGEAIGWESEDRLDERGGSGDPSTPSSPDK